MKHHHTKKEFKKERTDRVDFRRRFYISYESGIKKYVLVRPNPIDDYKFDLEIYWIPSKRLVHRTFESFAVALDHALIYVTDTSRWSRKGNADMY